MKSFQTKTVFAVLLMSLVIIGTKVTFSDESPTTPPPAAGEDENKDEYGEYGDPTPGAAAITREQMLKDAQNIACKDSLCKLFSVSVNKQTFTITAWVGTGNNGMMGGYGYGSGYGSGGFYGGNVGNGNAGNIGGLIGGGSGYGNPYNSGEPSYGLQITWEKSKCTKTVNVDRSVYDAVTTYMRKLVNTNPGEEPTYPQFTPAEQTMILFYTTVMELTKGQTCS